MGTEVEIKVKDRARGLRLKKHLEMEHPSTMGKIKVETNRKGRRIVSGGNIKSVNKILKSVPNFEASAARFTQL